jgi:hypothetical protein
VLVESKRLGGSISGGDKSNRCFIDYTYPIEELL